MGLRSVQLPHCQVRGWPGFGLWLGFGSGWLWLPAGFSLGFRLEAARSGLAFGLGFQLDLASGSHLLGF